MASMMQTFQNPQYLEEMKAKVASVREDPELKPVLDEISAGGPSAMMKSVFLPGNNSVRFIQGILWHVSGIL